MQVKAISIDTDYFENLPFEMDAIETPQFPDLELSILETGAVGDGITDNTQAINNAIKSVSEQGYHTRRDMVYRSCHITKQRKSSHTR